MNEHTRIFSLSLYVRCLRETSDEIRPGPDGREYHECQGPVSSTPQHHTLIFYLIDSFLAPYAECASARAEMDQRIKDVHLCLVYEKKKNDIVEESPGRNHVYFYTYLLTKPSGTTNIYCIEYVHVNIRTCTILQICRM